MQQSAKGRSFLPKETWSKDAAGLSKEDLIINAYIFHCGVFFLIRNHYLGNKSRYSVGKSPY